MYNNEISTNFPMFVKLKEMNQIDGNPVENFAIYSPIQFVKTFHVNETIYELIKTQRERNSNNSNNVNSVQTHMNNIQNSIYNQINKNIPNALKMST